MNTFHNFSLGAVHAESLLKDPKHLAFVLSRYKLSSKMMQKCKYVIEIGCGEGIGTLMFLAETSAKIIAIDFDKTQIEYAKRNILSRVNNRITFVCQDIISKPYKGKKGDGMVCIDVIEHIHPSEQKRFFQNCVASIEKGAVAVFGTPNKHAHKYASDKSKQGHINLFDPPRLARTLEKYFSHVFLFSMNDEMVHTGFNELAHYLIALCVK